MAGNHQRSVLGSFFERKAASSQTFAPLRFGDDLPDVFQPQVRSQLLKVKQQRNRLAIQVWHPRGEAVPLPPSKLRVRKPLGNLRAKRLSSRRPQHHMVLSTSVIDLVDEQSAQVQPAVVALLHQREDASDSPAPSAPETPVAAVTATTDTFVFALPVQPCNTTVSSGASAATTHSPTTSEPAATPTPSGPSGLVGPQSVLSQPSVPLQASPVTVDASPVAGTFYHPSVIAQCAVLAISQDPVEARRAVSKGLSSHPKTLPTVLSQPPLPAPPAARKPSRAKGGKHASSCPGPWASALDNMPPAVQTVNQRVAAGTSHVPVPHTTTVAIEKERAARALVSLLPYACAEFILRDPDWVIAARERSDTAERLVRTLSAFGVGSLNNAYSAYGRLVTWVATNHPEAVQIYGSLVADYMVAVPPSQTALDSLTWLSDRCGIDIPTRAPVCKAFKRPGTTVEHDKESASLAFLMGLCALALRHQSPQVRGQAAGFYALAKLALRLEQSRSCAINAFVSRVHEGVARTFLSVAILSDKHPDPAKMRPRPRWAAIDDLHADPNVFTKNSVHRALVEMLTGAEDVKCLILETNSKTGDPSTATGWVMTPLEQTSRVDASIRGLAKLMGAPPEVCKVLHGHSFKRCLLNVAKSSPVLNSATDGQELGAFSMSTSQKPELEPTAELLRKHELRASVLPDLYASKACVSSLMERIAKVETVLVRARDRAWQSFSALPFLDGWEIFHAQGPEPLLLTHTQA